MSPVNCKLCGNPPVMHRPSPRNPQNPFRIACVSCKSMKVETAARGKEEEAVAVWNAAMGATDG